MFGFPEQTGKAMPDPRTLQIGDQVRFVSIPEEWSTPGYTIHRDSIEFMKKLLFIAPVPFTGGGDR